MKIDYEVGNKYSGFDWVSCPQGCIVKRISPLTGNENNINLDITKEQYFAWRDGTLIQNAFPNLTVDEREFILTGLLGDEFEKFVGIVEDSDEDDYYG